MAVPQRARQCPLAAILSRCPPSYFTCRWLFSLGLICIGICLALAFYLVVYLPYVARIELDWEVYCPRVIPTATVAGLLSCVL